MYTQKNTKDCLYTGNDDGLKSYKPKLFSKLILLEAQWQYFSFSCFVSLQLCIYPYSF